MNTNLIGLMKRLWHRRQRSVDLSVLWPACKAQTNNLERARAAFTVHARQDQAWLSLGYDEMLKKIGNLS